MKRTRKEAIAAGELYYFTGKPCKRGHIFKRYVVNYSCVPCSILLSKRFHERNPERYREKANAYAKEYHKANKKKASIYAKEYRLRNLEKLKIYEREYRKANKKKASIYAKEYRLRNLEKLKIYGREYQEKNRK